MGSLGLALISPVPRGQAFSFWLRRYVDPERVHAVAPIAGRALDRGLLLIDLADLLVELAVVLRHLACVL